ncbi:hypothetical protein TNCV_4884921 [Trichonephila clavipes]|nr:hypothetical protein TNCV_4884921 [Trichonephila clavipes]
MSDIDMEPPSPSLSYKAYEELMLSRPTTPSSLPAESSTDCGKRRAAMTRLKNQETMIEGYRKFPATFKAEKMSMEFISNSVKASKKPFARNQLVTPSEKRKNVKNNADDFVVPNKTARPTTPTPVLQPIDVQNSFTDLVQDPDLPHTDNSAEIPKIPPHCQFI